VTSGPDYAAWVERYIGAWNSNDPDEIGALFADDAAYSPTSYAKPWQGRDEIVAQWLARKDEPGAWTFSYEVIGAVGEIGFLRGVTDYPSDEEEYHNLWEITLDSSGRCTRFVEWWMLRPTGN
jgi:ketosteroid isomerase-like protein